MFSIEIFWPIWRRAYCMLCLCANALANACASQKHNWHRTPPPWATRRIRRSEILHCCHDSSMHATGMRPRFFLAKGLARIWTAIAGFRVQSANRYTTRPVVCNAHSEKRSFDVCILATTPVRSGFRLAPLKVGGPVLEQGFQQSDQVERKNKRGWSGS